MQERVLNTEGDVGSVAAVFVWREFPVVDGRLRDRSGLAAGLCGCRYASSVLGTFDLDSAIVVEDVGVVAM